MAERRFWFVIDKGKLEYVQDNVNNEKITISELEDMMNEQQDRITYWKHKVYALLWILSQFDEEKVKELLMELDGGDVYDTI